MAGVSYGPLPIASNTRLGPFTITEPVGAGGMGEVYRAHDARLGRDVAIKVLPSSLTANPASLARFEREARAIAALNHPNVVNLHDVGTQDGISYVVMELLQGETLRARLTGSTPHTASLTTPKADTHGTKGYGLGRKKALEIAQQIAQGLAAAHARGIVHRDLKPENVFLTTDGRVKILDFGLARAAVQLVGDAETQLAPAPSSDSVPGMVLGTAGYMAPEQVRGQTADQQADIFAFGAVLYEMLTGARAFPGETAIEAMNAILKADPFEQPVAAAALSGPLESLVRHCLEKQPDERFQSARDLAFQLQSIASGALSSTAERALSSRRDPRQWMLIAAVTIVALMAGIVTDRTIRPGATGEMLTTLSAMMPPGVDIYTPFTPARSGGLAVSPDGRRLAFAGVATQSTVPQIFVRALDSSVARPVSGTENGQYPSWSPDGRRIAFWQGQKLKSVSAEGGAPQVLADMLSPRSPAAWGPDDTLLFHANYQGPLLRVPASGGSPAEILPIPGQDLSWFSPVWLSDGRRFLIVRFAYADEVAQTAGIYVGSVDSKTVTLLVPGPITEVAFDDQELFYRRGAELVAQRFDARNAKLTGQARVLSDHVSMVAAARGTLAYFDPPRGQSEAQRITVFSRSGAVLSRLGDAGAFRDPKLSPDGRFLAVARAGETGLFSIWTYDIARQIDARITGASFVSPAWNPDGKSLFAARASGLWRFDLAGGGAPHLVRPLPRFATVYDISPDSREALIALAGDGTGQLASLGLDGTSDARPIGALQTRLPHAALSPDGKWLAVVWEEGAAQRLSVQPYPGPGARIPVLAAPALHPHWRSDGRELFFARPSSGGETPIESVSVTWTAAGPEFGPPQVLFTVQRPILGNLGFDVSRDGQKFVIVIAGEPDPSPITVRLRGKSE